MREFAESMLSTQSHLVPRVSWIVDIGHLIGLTERLILTAIWLALLLASSGLLAGLFCRTSAVVAWFLHLAVAKSAGLLAYGLDNLMTIGLFYLMLAPLPDRVALDRTLRNLPALNPRLVGFFRRSLQLHLCVIYFFGGLTKALGSGWWDGSNLWRALTRPPFDVVSPDTIVQFAALLPALGIAAWVIELAYPVMIWSKATRRSWLVLTCAMHLSIGLFMGMYLFALVMLVLNVAAFGPSAPAAKNIPTEDTTLAHIT